MKKFTMILMCVFGLISTIKSQTDERYITLQKLIQSSDVVFEGIFIKKEASFNDKERGICTPYIIKVLTPISKTIANQTITVILEGGTIGNISGDVMDGPGSVPYEKTIYFLSKKDVDGKLMPSCMIDISSPEYISGTSAQCFKKPYFTLEELYTDINKATGTNLTIKKSANENEINQNKIEIYTPIKDGFLFNLSVLYINLTCAQHASHKIFC